MDFFPRLLVGLRPVDHFKFPLQRDMHPVPQIGKKPSCPTRVVLLQATPEPAMTKPPPVPPDNQSKKGTGDPKTGNAHELKKGRSHIENPREQGQAGNTAQNTTHQGYQQDR
jgi:hypothetical protein